MVLSFSLEEDFVSWREQFWPAVCEHFGVEALGDESRFIHILFFFLLAFEVFTTAFHTFVPLTLKLSCLYPGLFLYQLFIILKGKLANTSILIYVF